MDSNNIWGCSSDFRDQIHTQISLVKKSELFNQIRKDFHKVKLLTSKQLIP